MANPNIKNGKFTRISNEIMEALIKVKLSGQELQAILFVIRKTYGFRKTEDIISLTQIAAAMGISKIRAQQVIAALVLRNILTVKENINGISRKLLFNSDYETWLTVKENINRIGKPKPLRKTLTTKETIYRQFKHLRITEEENERLLKEGYTQKELDSIYDDIENFSKNKKYSSLILTARKWLKMNKAREPKPQQSLADYIAEQEKKK